jgi:hypothetical protein
MAASLLLALAFQSAAAPPQLAAELQPLAFQVGSCWRATFPGTTQTDTHCFTPLFGGRMIRDRHVVAGAPTPYSGETIYRWDPEARRIRYEYYASDGGYSSGLVEPTAQGLNFPEEAYLGGNGQRLRLRNTLVRHPDGSYEGTSEMQQGSEWRRMWSMRFTRVGPAPD